MTEQTQRTVELLSTDERESRSGALQHIQPLLVKLRQHPSAKPFLQPVDPVRLRVPDYYSRVKEPMDLSLVKLRLTKGYYASIDDLARDVARVWENACAFNPVGSIVHRFAQECR
ncbi:Bromodomain-containing protein, partial [Pavlovales sp. CCMP2436]